MGGGEPATMATAAGQPAGHRPPGVEQSTGERPSSRAGENKERLGERNREKKTSERQCLERG